MKKLLILILMSIHFFTIADEAPSVPYLTIFEEKAKKYDVPVSALLAIAKTTTNFNADFMIPKRCGLMYLDATRTLFNDESIDCYDPATNIELGAKWLAEVRSDVKGDLDLALKFYWGGVREPNEPARNQYEKQYEEDVMSFYRLYKPFYN